MQDNLRIGTVNVRGLNCRKKRLALFQQLKEHCDAIMFQDTHLTDSTQKEVERELKGTWVFNNDRSNRGGVAICLLKPAFVKETWTGTKNLAGLGVIMDNQKLMFITGYAPCCSTRKQDQELNLAFLKESERLILKARGRGYRALFGGDLNFIRDDWLDAEGGDPKVYDQQSQWINNMESQMDIIDVFRFRRENERMFTFSPTGPNVRGIYRRLDYLLFNSSDCELITADKIVVSGFSDHRLLTVSLKLCKDDFGGKGIWKHNDSLLKDKDYISMIEETIDKLLKYPESSDPQFLWEWLKFHLKQASVKFSRHRAQQKRAEGKRLEGLYADCLNNPGIFTAEEKEDRLRDLNKHYEEIAESVKFRANVEYVEKGEKVTQFFFKAIAKNKQASNIETLKTDTHPIGTKTREETMEALYSHFEKEFSDPSKDVVAWNGWGQDLPQVSNGHRMEAEKELTLNELTSMLFNGMIMGKSPGDDGLTVAFYRCFWSRLGRPMLASLTAGVERGELSSSQKRSVIRLIQKKGKNPDEISGWRPISLINVDAKIFSKCLAARVKGFLSDIIGPQQQAYTGKVHVAESHLIMDKLLERARSGDVEGLICAVDFRSAFSTVKHKFLWEALERMNVGPKLINFLKVLYKNSNSSVLNFGTTTKRFPLERGARQGDPVAPYLFIIAMEVLLRRLRKSLTGIDIFDSCQPETDSVFADDLTIFANSSQEVDKALMIIDSFHSVAGLEVNWTKTELLELRQSYVGQFKLKVVPKIKITGRIFNLDYNEMIKDNWEGVLSKTKAILNVHASRKLSVIGRSTIINAQVLPLILFTGASLPLPKDVEKILNKDTFKFLWNGPDKITRSNAMKPFREGGVNMPHFRGKIEALHCRWITNLEGTPDRSWKKLFWEMKCKDGFDLATPITMPSTSGFTGHCISTWNNILSLLPMQPEMKIKSFLKKTTINILGNQLANLLCFSDLNDLGGFATVHKLNFLQTAHLKKIGPIAKGEIDSWWSNTAYKYRRFLNNVNSMKWPIPGNLNSVDPEVITSMSKVADWCKDKSPYTVTKQRDVYKLLSLQVMPTLSNFARKLGSLDWPKVFQLNFQVSSYSIMRAFMIKSQHGILCGNKDFKRYGIKQFEHCTMCDKVDRQDSTHVLAGCERSIRLYANLEQTLTCSPFTFTERLLGCDPAVPRPPLERKKLNLLRKYIYDCNHTDVTPRWEKYLQYMDRVYSYEYAIADKNDKIQAHLKIWNM